MSGHSKWSTIKRKKAAVDAKRGRIFTRLLREIQVAARMGGGNSDSNVRLKAAIQSAKDQSVPGDNIERAVKRGTGDLEGVAYEEVVYEAYGPGGVAILIKVLTDNKNRTVADVRHALDRHSGRLAGANAVSYQFQDKGVLGVAKADIGEEQLMETALEAGAEDISDEGDYWEVLTDPKDCESVRAAIQALGKKIEGEVRAVPRNTVKVAGHDAESLLKLMDALDDLDDVQNVVANFDIDDKELQSLSKGAAA
jgi:YebC/PmpR family DNA-binding regulatory protein